MKITYSLGCTVNIGNYQSMKPEVSVELEHTDFDTGLSLAETLVRNALQKNVDAINNNYGTMFELPPKSLNQSNAQSDSNGQTDQT